MFFFFHCCFPLCGGLGALDYEARSGEVTGIFVPLFQKFWSLVSDERAMDYGDELAYDQKTTRAVVERRVFRVRVFSPLCDLASWMDEQPV